MAPFSPREREQREKRQLQKVRDTFFKGADSSQVSDERAFRRLTQDLAEKNFKDIFTTEVEKTGVIDPKTGKKTGVLLQMTPDAPRTLAAERERLANLYGPTLGEIGGDFMRGLGNITREIGVPIVGTGQKIVGGLQDLYNFLTTKSNQAPQVGTVFPRPKSNVKDFFGSMNSGIATSPIFVPPTFNDQKILREDLPPIQTPSSSAFNNMDMSGFRAETFGLPTLLDIYNRAQNPELKTDFGNFRIDNLFKGDPTLGYGNTVLINGVPVDLSATIGQQGLGLGASMTFKKGGPVDKHGGLGYKLK